MKKFFLLISMMCSLMMLAQVPQGINYQAAVRDANGVVAANASATFQISFIDKADNSVDYVESFVTTTDEFGLVNFVIGQGVPNGAAFSTLNWTKQFKLKIEVNMGQGLILLGTQDLVSVPYALEAGHANMSLTQLNDVDVTGAVFGEVLMFDGATWIPAIVSGSFGLPFLATDPNLVSFAITNTSALGGTAVTGKTTTNNANATGVRGESTGVNGTGVNGKAAGTNSIGVLGTNTTGVAIKGTTQTSNTGGAAIYGENNGTEGNGVLGVANFATGTGVKGESGAGIGVVGYSNTNVGVYGSTISGAALKGVSLSGNALETSGNVKISGGNTAPGTGKVLTSDAQGNATWQTPSATPNIAFRSSGTTIAVPSDQNYTMKFSSEAYDFGSAFDPTTSIFTAPVAGVYHFDASLEMIIYSDVVCFDPDYSEVSIRVIYPNTNTGIIAGQGAKFTNTLAFCDFSGDASCDIFLPAGTQVFMVVYQTNDDTLSVMPSGGGTTFFSGHLVLAQ